MKIITPLNNTKNENLDRKYAVNEMLLQEFTKLSLDFIQIPSSTYCLWHKVSFNRGKESLNSVLSFFLTGCQTHAEERSLSNYLPIAARRIGGFMSFLMA